VRRNLPPASCFSAGLEGHKRRRLPSKGCTHRRPWRQAQGKDAIRQPVHVPGQPLPFPCAGTAFFYLVQGRRGRDSNPRYPCGYSGLANRRTRPAMRPLRVRETCSPAFATGRLATQSIAQYARARCSGMPSGQPVATRIRGRLTAGFAAQFHRSPSRAQRSKRTS
jgi:hypothetical protein